MMVLLTCKPNIDSKKSIGEFILHVDNSLEKKELGSVEVYLLCEFFHSYELKVTLMR